MMWIIVIGLALVAFGLMTAVLEAPRAGWEVMGAALLCGLAGYAMQGRPGFAGAPKDAPESAQSAGAAGVAARQKLSADPADMSNKFIVIADALARNGQFASAAEVLRGAVEANPADAQAWLAMGNALVAHANGTVSPAAVAAYGRAARAAPDSPGPPFFLGMALITSGRLDEGRAIWADLLARSPADAPWRPELAQRLQEVDRFLASRKAGS